MSYNLPSSATSNFYLLFFPVLTYNITKMTNNKSILIIIPTYNERDNIASLLGKIYSLEMNLAVLVIDDNSPDKTAQAAAELQNTYPNLYIINRKRKMGLGSAYKEGFKYALKNGYDIIIQMDADLSHLPQYIPRMVDLLEDHDLVIGSRYVKAGGVSGWPFSRSLLSRFANIFSKKMLRLHVSDLTSGFKCIRSHALESMDFNNISARGYAFQIEMVYKILLRRFKAIEYPIIFIGRTKERSKISFGIIIEAFFRVILLAFKNITS